MERLTVRQAAARLNVSPATVRRMIAAGELRGERERRPQGSRWIVLWDENIDAPHHESAGVSGTSQERDARIAHLEDEIRFLRGLVAELTRRVPELPAGSPPPEPPAEMPHSAPESGEKPPRPRRRSWWRRWFSG